jgi:hypothetical protein
MEQTYMENFSDKGEEQNNKAKKRYNTPELREHGTVQDQTLKAGGIFDNAAYS